MKHLTINKSKIATDLSFTEDTMIVYYEDGELAVPLKWFPRLRNANLDQLQNWRLISDGEGIHWEELDEDILVENLLSNKNTICIDSNASLKPTYLLCNLTPYFEVTLDGFS